MEDRAFRKSREISFEEQSKDDPLVHPLQQAQTSASISPKGKTPEVEPREEEEQVDIPTTSGRTSRELRQMLQDAEDFVRAPRNEKRERRQPDRYQALET